jgi:hypothetical protein
MASNLEKSETLELTIHICCLTNVKPWVQTSVSLGDFTGTLHITSAHCCLVLSLVKWRLLHRGLAVHFPTHQSSGYCWVIPMLTFNPIFTHFLYVPTSRGLRSPSPHILVSSHQTSKFCFSRVCKCNLLLF